MKNTDTREQGDNFIPKDWTGSVIIMAPPFKPGQHDGKYGLSEYVEVGLIVTLDDQYVMQQEWRKQWVWAAGLRGQAEGLDLVAGRLVTYETKFKNKAIGMDALHPGEFSAITSWADQNLITEHGLWYVKLAETLL